MVGFVTVLTLWLIRQHSATPTAPTGGIPAIPITTATGRADPPPWPAPRDVAGAVAAAGLPMLGAEGTVEHLHAHLDVIVNGQPVTVPAEIGIDETAGMISPLHIHDTTGVIHIESPTRAPFSLAQFFTEWQVALSGTQLGGLRGGNDDAAGPRAFVNGHPVAGNPGAIILGRHDVIVLVYGPTPPDFRATFDWGRL